MMLLPTNYESEEEYQEPPQKRMKFTRIEQLNEEEEDDHHKSFEIIHDHCPELCPPLPDDIRSISVSKPSIVIEDSSNSNKGLWPTYIHLPVVPLQPTSTQSSTNDDDKTIRDHPLYNLMTLIDQNELHVSVTTTRLFAFPVCLEIARKLFDFSQSLKRKHLSGMTFTSNRISVVENLNVEDKHVEHHPLIYLTHHLDQHSAFVGLVKQLQDILKLRSCNGQEKVQEQVGYFKIDDDWKVHITVGKYDTMGNVKQEKIDEWLKSDPLTITQTEWAWNGEIIMFCGNRKYIWNCFEKS